MKILLIRFIGSRVFKRHIPWHYSFYKDILESKGNTVDVIDNSVEDYSIEELVDLILDKEYDLVGTGGMATIYNNLKALSSLLKSKRLVLFLSGSNA